MTKFKRVFDYTLLEKVGHITKVRKKYYMNKLIFFSFESIYEYHNKQLQ